MLEFEIAAAETLEARPETIALDVLYEDDDLLVVDKPAGMVTHPAHGATHGTLVNALLAHAGDLPGESLRAGLVHRLDRDTSGLLVVAKREETLRALGVADAAPAAYAREYLGLVCGVPANPSGTIEGADWPRSRKPPEVHHRRRRQAGGHALRTARARSKNTPN